MTVQPSGSGYAEDEEMRRILGVHDRNSQHSANPLEAVGALRDWLASQGTPTADLEGRRLRDAVMGMSMTLRALDVRPVPDPITPR